MKVVKEDFITTLRNQVAKQEGQFEKKNLLILFSGRLDSLLGGSEDLTKEGMPLNGKIFREQLIKSINKESKLKRHEKAILQYLLEKMEEHSSTDNHSIFDYQGIVGTINQGGLKKEDYHNLGLFPHKELSTISTPKALKNNIRDNNEVFEEIEHVFQHGDSSNDLDKLLSDKGIKELNSVDSDKDWKTTDFSDISKWKEERSKIAPAEFIGKPPYECSLGGNAVFGRADGNSTTKKRNTNIIVFNPMNIPKVTISLKFNKKINKDAIKLDKNEALNISTFGSRIDVEIIEKESKFWRLQYHDASSGKNFQFKILMFKCPSYYLESIKKEFIIEKSTPHRIELKHGEYPLIFNKEGSIGNNVVLEEKGIYEVKENDQLKIKIKNDYESDTVPFDLKIKDETILFSLVTEKPKLQPINGLKVWKDKRELSKLYKYEVNNVTEDKDVIKLTTDSEEFTVSGGFRKRLEWENSIIQSGGLSWAININGNIDSIELTNIPSRLSKAFSDLLDLYKNNNNLPSLTPLEGEYVSKAKRFVNIFLECIDQIENKATATKTLNDLMQIGMVCENYHHQDIHISSLHPLMLAYQIALTEQIGSEELYDAILTKLNPINLLPFIRWKNDSIYSPTEDSSFPEWIRYNNKKDFKKGISKSFVRKLVNDKINEFQHHFSYLFVNPQSPIVINAFNLGDCKEVLQGLFDYYEKRLSKEKSIDSLPCIDINIYGSDKWVTKFEELTFYQNAQELKDKDEELKLRLKTPYNYDSDDLLNTFRKKVHFYTKSFDDISYAHISFFHFDQMKIGYSDMIMDDVPTGIALNGLFSDLTSEFSSQSYRTGFSIKNLGEDRTLLESTAIAYNSLARVTFSNLLYENDKSICSSIDFNIKTSLDNIYAKSQWVTFIEPRVGLNFFKENEKVVIIHYSDQYNNTSGYDAITVTKKTEQYQYVLNEFLRTKGISLGENESNTANIINLFNSINGDWLLKIISQNNPQYKNEKLSLLSAIKASLALYHHPNVIWIPTSLEEVLRVSGNAGLSQKEGIFSTKNLGKTGVHSDDLLLIGLEKIDEKLKMYLYPIEVKIGKNDSSVIKKGKEQGEKTAKLLSDAFKLNGDDDNASNSFKVGLYKNFFAKIVLVTAEKLKLYNVWNEQDIQWDTVLSDYRKELLNNEFEISDLSKYIGSYGVFLFGGSFRRKIERDDDLMLCQFINEDGYKFLEQGIDYWIDTLVIQPSSIDKDLLLINQYKIDDKEKNTVITTPKIESKVIENPELSNNASPPNNENNEPKRPIEILFGHDVNTRKEVKWYPSTTSKVLHTNTGIIGTMGTGKTQFTKSLVSQLVWESKNNVGGQPIGILIFDYKGDYVGEDFVKATNAKVFDLYHLPYNPLAIDIYENSLPLLPLHTASTIKETISKAYGLGKKQEQALKSVIMDAYEAKGIHKAKKDTWSRPAPTIADVCELFMMDEKVAQDSLYAALDSLHDFEIFEPDTSKTQSLFDLLEGVLVINLSGYDESVQNLVVAITLDLFYSQMQKAGHSKIDGDFRQLNKMILVDEADNFLSKNFNSIRKILKEGREFGVGSILSTQFLSHFSTSDNDYSTYILTWIVHRVNEIRTREVDSLFKLDSKDATNQLMNEIKSLEKHHSVVNLAGSDPLFIEDKAFWELWKEMGNKIK